MSNWQRIDTTRWRAIDRSSGLLIRVGDELRELDGANVHFYTACCGRCTDDPACVYPLHEAEHIRSLPIPAIARQAKTEEEAFDMLAVLDPQS